MTILATSVFERMWVADPKLRARLRLYGWWLVSADSSPLTVKGELELTVVFPGLSCVMLFVVASIGVLDQMDCWERRPCSRVCQLDLRTGQLWADG